MEAGCWRSSWPLFWCAAPAGRRTISNGTPGFGASLRVHPIVSHAPSLHPIGLPSGVDLPHLTVEVPGKGAHGLGSDVVWWVRVCVCVAGRTRGGKVISQLLQCQGERESRRSSCTAKEHFNLQYNGVPCELIDHRCFITYFIPIHDKWAGLLSICQCIVYRQ